MQAFLRTCAAVVCLFACSSLPAREKTTQPAADKLWSTQIDSSLAAARAAKSNTLLWFSGSGWNAASDAVEPALLDPAFMSAAGTAFLLVRADFPAGRKNEATVDPAYSVWAERFNVTKLPVLILIDETGRPYARIDSPTGDATACRELLSRTASIKAARDADLNKAESLTGIERARQLDRGLAHVGEFATAWYKPIVAEIVKLDADNAAGLAAKYRPQLSAINIDDVVQSRLYPLLDQSKFAEALAVLDRLLAEAKPTTEQRQLLLAFKGQVAYSSGDQRQALQWLDDAAALDPTGPAAARIAKAKAQILETPAAK